MKGRCNHVLDFVVPHMQRKDSLADTRLYIGVPGKFTHKAKRVWAFSSAGEGALKVLLKCDKIQGVGRLRIWSGSQKKAPLQYSYFLFFRVVSVRGFQDKTVP